MLSYLAASGHSGGDLGGAGLAGLIASAVATLFGAIATIRLGRIRSSRQKEAFDTTLGSAAAVSSEREHAIKQLQEVEQQITEDIEVLRDVDLQDIDPNSGDLRSGSQELRTSVHDALSAARQHEVSAAQGLVFEEEIKHLQTIRISIAGQRNRLMHSQSRLAEVRAERHLNQIRSLFSHARIAFYSFLSISVISSAILLYGAYLAIYGHIASGVIVALSSAVPGGFSAGLYRIKRSADHQAENALALLDAQVEREAQLDRIQMAAQGVRNPETVESIQILRALKAAFPDAPPRQLASLLNEVLNNPSQTEDASREK